MIFPTRQPPAIQVRVPPALWRAFVAGWLRKHQPRMPLLTGSHPRAVPGDWEGLDLSGIRPQQPGDSHRRLVARASARMNRPMVRVDLPAWRLPTVVVLDRSPGMLLACPLGSPARVGSEIAKALIGVCSRLGDPTGVALAGSGKIAFQPPRVGATSASRRLADRPPPTASGLSAFAQTLGTLPAHLRQAAGLVVLTDGLDPLLPRVLGKMAGRHPLWLILLESPLPGPECRTLPWIDATAGRMGRPLNPEGWRALEERQATLRMECAQTVTSRQQPLTWLRLENSMAQKLATGGWIFCGPPGAKG